MINFFNDYANQDLNNGWLYELMPMRCYLDTKILNSLLPNFRAKVSEKCSKIYGTRTVLKKTRNSDKENGQADWNHKSECKQAQWWWRCTQYSSFNQLKGLQVFHQLPLTSLNFGPQECRNSRSNIRFSFLKTGRMQWLLWLSWLEHHSIHWKVVGLIPVKPYT